MQVYQKKSKKKFVKFVGMLQNISKTWAAFATSVLYDDANYCANLNQANGFMTDRITTVVPKKRECSEYRYITKCYRIFVYAKSVF